MIDTDRYEGHTPGPWKLDWPDSEIIKGCMFHIISDNKELLERFESKPTSIDEMEDRYKNKTDSIYDQYITSISCGPLYTKDGEFISEINARLIADAPLLLEEVKRLREQGRKLVEAAERVRSEISDQDTGWYYQLGNHIEKMNRLVKE